MQIHMELERKLAEFKQTEAAVVFQSGFTANAGTVSSILGRDAVIVSDELNHASIIDGARLSRAAIKVFPHRDVAAARRIVQETAARARGRSSSPTASSAWTATSARFPELCDLADEFGCIMMVDDAHASGVFGSHGRGTVDHFGHARPRRRPGRDAVEGDRRAGRLRRRLARADRVPLPPRAAVPVLDVPPAFGRRHAASPRSRCSSRSRS